MKNKVERYRVRDRIELVVILSVVGCVSLWASSAIAAPPTLKQAKSLLCPSKKTPKVFEHYVGSFSNKARQDMVVIHSPCDKSKKRVKALVSWFYVRDGELSRLSQNSLYLQPKSCTQSKHHDLDHVYCTVKAENKDSFDHVQALRFYNSYRAGFTAILYPRRKSKCRSEGIINDSAKSLKVDGSLLIVTSQATACIKSGKKFKTKGVTLAHRIEVSPTDFVVSHKTTNAENKSDVTASGYNRLLGARTSRRSSYGVKRTRHYASSQPRSNLVGSGIGIGRGSGGFGLGRITKAKPTKKPVVKVGLTAKTEPIKITKNKEKANKNMHVAFRKKHSFFSYCIQKESRKNKLTKKATYTYNIQFKTKAGRVSTIKALKGSSNFAKSCIFNVIKRTTFAVDKSKSKAPFVAKIKIKTTPPKSK